MAEPVLADCSVRTAKRIFTGYWTMRTSQIEIYLQKVSQGDKSFIDRLCVQLSDRLVFVPAIKNTPQPKVTGAASEPGVERVNVFQMQDGTRLVVPIFTTQARFNDWCKGKGIQFECLSVLGGDLCMAVGEKCWVAVDLGTPSAVELQPVLVKKIANAGIEQNDSNNEPPRAEPPAGDAGVGGSKSDSSSEQVEPPVQAQSVSQLVSPDLYELYAKGTESSPEIERPKKDVFIEDPYITERSKSHWRNLLDIFGFGKKKPEIRRYRFFGTLRIPLTASR